MLFAYVLSTFYFSAFLEEVLKKTLWCHITPHRPTPKYPPQIYSRLYQFLLGLSPFSTNKILFHENYLNEAVITHNG